MQLEWRQSTPIEANTDLLSVLGRVLNKTMRAKAFGVGSCLASALIVVALVILMMPARWVSDGAIEVPVNIFVFDAVTSKSINKADCRLLKTRLAQGSQEFHERTPEPFSPARDWSEEERFQTDASGSCVINFNFGTSASDRNPNPKAFLTNVAVQVEAPGYGGIVLPLRNEDRLSSDLRRDGRIRVSIGLMPLGKRHTTGEE